MNHEGIAPSFGMESLSKKEDSLGCFACYREFSLDALSI